MRIKINALGVVAVIALVVAAEFFMFQAITSYVVNNVLNECPICGARTLDRYHEQLDDGTWVWICPLCAEYK